jgi:hypothetical protein
VRCELNDDASGHLLEALDVEVMLVFLAAMHGVVSAVVQVDEPFALLPRRHLV